MSKKFKKKRNEYADPCHCGHRRSKHTPETASHFAICNTCKYEPTWTGEGIRDLNWLHPFKLDAFKFIEKLTKVIKKHAKK